LIISSFFYCHTRTHTRMCLERVSSFFNKAFSNL